MENWKVYGRENLLMYLFQCFRKVDVKNTR